MTTTGKAEFYDGNGWSQVGTVFSITAGDGLDGGTITDTGTISLPDIATGGTYAYPSSIIIDDYGRVLTITAGTSAPISKVSGTANEITVSGTSNITIALASDPVLPGNVTVNSTGFLTLPVGTTAQRPSIPVIGMMRINTDLV